MCQANDYSLLTANTGVGQIDNANPNLNGTGSVVTIFTAGATNGSIIRSVTIKSIPSAKFSSIQGFSQEGIVRLFIQTDDAATTVLYKEVIIPPSPVIQSWPLPSPAFTTYEVVLTGDVKLQPGYKLLASTSVTNTFNIISEGVDWTYPDPIPDVCCNFMQESAITGIGVVSAANENYDGAGNIVSVFTADSAANGSTIKSITIKALQSTHEGIVRLFITPDGGTTYFLMREIHIPQTEQSAFAPSYKQVINMDFKLAPGYTIAATTLLGESFAITIEGVNWSYPI